MPRLLLISAALVLASAVIPAVATTSAPTTPAGTLTCQNIALPDKSSCDQACTAQHALCVGVQTAMAPAPDPVTCETRLVHGTGTVCRCCAIR